MQSGVNSNFFSYGLHKKTLDKKTIQPMIAGILADESRNWRKFQYFRVLRI